MVIFDKNITIEQKLNAYDKQSLKILAGDLGLRKLSKLRKAELIERITEKLLDPEIMFYRGAILTEKEISVLENGCDGPVQVDEENANAVGTLNEMDFVVVSHGEYLVPGNLAAVWKKVKNDEFAAYHKRALWVWECLYWAEEMYVYTPFETMLEVVNSKKGLHMTAEELRNIVSHFPEDCLWSIMFDKFFLSRVYATDMDALDAIRYEQADKSYYIPTPAEVEEFYETGALLSGHSYQEMLRFLEREIGLEHKEAEAILFDLWEKISQDDDSHGTIQWFMDLISVNSEKQEEKLLNLYMNLTNNTRRLLNRGHSPVELARQYKGKKGSTPIITAGSTQAAEILAQIAPEIEQMGLKVDLESNAGTVPVISEADSTKIREKKVYPNDPCPCGSGKKYKKCCGRNVR